MNEIIRGIHFEVKKEHHTAKSKEILNSFENNDNDKLASIFENNKFSKELFQYIDSTKFFETITNTSNKLISKFNRILEERYSSMNIGEFLYEDLNFLVRLNNRPEKYVESNTKIDGLRKFTFNSSIDILKIECKHLEDTKK